MEKDGQNFDSVRRIYEGYKDCRFLSRLSETIKDICGFLQVACFEVL